VLLLAALVTGCGPVEYVSQVSRRATTALAQARNEGAERLAPYEYTAASEYLNKAREEAARAGSLARDRAARGETPPAGRP
jgi:hypothetical protein